MTLLGFYALNQSGPSFNQAFFGTVVMALGTVILSFAFEEGT